MKIKIIAITNVQVFDEWRDVVDDEVGEGGEDDVGWNEDECVNDDEVRGDCEVEVEVCSEGEGGIEVGEKVEGGKLEDEKEVEEEVVVVVVKDEVRANAMNSCCVEIMKTLSHILSIIRRDNTPSSNSKKSS